MRNLTSLAFFLIYFTSLAFGQTTSFNCDERLLNEGQEFQINDPKLLEGTYNFTIVPDWDPTAKKASVQLHLVWEDRYVELQKDSMYSPLVNHPLIGYTKGDFQDATSANFNEEMSQTDPFDPGIRYYADEKILKSPGRAVDPSCHNCIDLSTDGPAFNFQIKRNVNGVLIGKWTEDFGILEKENSEGKMIDEATGYFCAEPQN